MNKRKSLFADELITEMKDKKFSAVSISDICNTMSCSRQSFYYYYDTLDNCLEYYVKESFKNQIKEDYLISDLFNYFDVNADFVRICNSDPASKKIFWECLSDYLEKILDFVFSKNIVEYLALYAEQKSALISFYVSGILFEVKQYVYNNHIPTKEKCISYCKAVIGTADDMRNTVIRFNR
jgi:AcrR family transcriptional regulator